MLKIKLGDFTDDCIIDVDAYFNLFKQPIWFTDPFVRLVIKEIDKSEVISDEYIKSPVFGGISPERLSSGTKALILMKMASQFTVYATRCGDNCLPFILQLAEEQDVTILLHHCPKFADNVHAFFVDTGKEVFSDHEFVEEYYKIRG